MPGDYDILHAAYQENGNILMEINIKGRQGWLWHKAAGRTWMSLKPVGRLWYAIAGYDEKGWTTLRKKWIKPETMRDILAWIESHPDDYVEVQFRAKDIPKVQETGLFAKLGSLFKPKAPKE